MLSSDHGDCCHNNGRCFYSHHAVTSVADFTVLRETLNEQIVCGVTTDQKLQSLLFQIGLGSIQYVFMEQTVSTPSTRNVTMSNYSDEHIRNNPYIKGCMCLLNNGYEYIHSRYIFQIS